MARFLVLVLVVGCKDDPGPPCDKVVDHMSEVMKQGMTGHDELQVNNRKTDIAFCEQKKFSKEARLCLLAAKDVAGIAACQKLLPPPPAK